MVRDLGMEVKDKSPSSSPGICWRQVSQHALTSAECVAGIQSLDRVSAIFVHWTN